MCPHSLYEKYKKLLTHLQPLALLLVRITFGFQFFMTGWGKLADIPKVTGFFTKLGIPFPELNAYIAGSTECFGGLLLLLGLASRFITLPLAFTMLVALATASRDSFFQIFHGQPDPDTNIIPSFIARFDTFLGQDPIPFLLAALVILAFGPGLLSLDHLLKKLLCKSCKESPHIETPTPAK